MQGFLMHLFIQFILFLIMFIMGINAGTYDLLIYADDRRNADCVLTGYRHLCYSPDDHIPLEREANKKCLRGTLWSFSMLEKNQITSETLLEWLIPFHLIEQYAEYLNSTNASRTSHVFICNCTRNGVGTNCEYESASRTADISELVKNQRPKSLTSYETLTTFIDEMICDDIAPALEWRQICDGISHCHNGQDESSCHLLEMNRCEKDEYQCRNGMCIPTEFLFDVAFDCMDSSDEQEIIENNNLFNLCTTQTRYECDERLCSREQFSCGNGQCIPSSNLILQEYGCENFRDIAYRCETIDSLVSNPKTYVGICQQTTMKLEPLTNTSDCITSLRYLLTADQDKSSIEIRNLSLKNIINACQPLIRYPEKAILSPVLSTFYNRSEFELFYSSEQNFSRQIPRKPHFYCLHGSMMCNNISMRLKKDHCMTKEEFKSLTRFSFLPVSHLFCQMALEQAFKDNSAIFSPSKLSDGQEHSTYYRCRNTSNSISLRRLNDGYIDCLFADDERHDLYRMIEPYRYRCETVELPRQYISYRQLGNGIKNCDDGSDEISTKVRWSSLKCDIDENYSCWVFQANGIDEDRVSDVQLSYHRHCDTIWDTMDGNDEKNCSQWICASNAHRCNQTGQCIQATYFCDGEFDCADGEDELHCPRKSRRWPFEDVCNETKEHFCMTQDHLDDPKSHYPCIPFSKAGDGHIDCIGGRDERNIFPCFDHQMLGDRFLCDNQTKCLDYTVICDGIEHCLDRTDELICYWNRSKCLYGYFGCKDMKACKASRCNPKDQCSDKSNWFWCPNSSTSDITYRGNKFHHKSNYEQSCYEHSFTREINQVSKISSISYETNQVLNFPLNGYCNRGFYLTGFNATKVFCFCPPSYYGNRCQYDSRRVTLRLRLDRRHRSDIPVLVTVLVTLLYNHSEIIDHDFVFDIDQGNQVKYNLYLLYPRPRLHGLYSVRIEAYHSVKFLAAWQYDVSPFDFLPVFRLAKILRFPSASLPLFCQENLCKNNGTCYLINNNEHLCLCPREWQGSFCEKPLFNVTCALHSLVRDRNICICPYSYYQPRCFVRNTKCQKSELLCPKNSDCYAISQQPPNRYWCHCGGSVCDVRSAQLTIYRNRSNQLPYLLQLLKISSDYPRIRQQILVYPSTQFPIHSKIRLRDPRNSKDYLPEIGLLFTFEPMKHSVDIVLHLLYINCSTVFRNLSVDLDVQSHRCQPLKETEIQSVKYLKNFCQETLRDGCFLLKGFICVCNSSFSEQTECISYHQRQTSCNHCYNQGYCVQGDSQNKSDFAFVCPRCTSGTLCQLLPSRFSISLEYLFEKTRWNTYHFIAPSFCLIFGIIFNGLCLITFVHPRARQTGAGIYLLINAMTSQLIVVILFVRILYLYMMNQLIFSERINQILCKGLPYLMFSLQYSSLWLLAFVTVERAVAAILTTQFLSFGKPRSAIFLSVSISIFVFTSVYSHLIQYKLINHPNNLYPWCARETEPNEKPFIQYISLIHQICPFCINIIGALTIIISISRSKAHIHHLSPRSTLKQQVLLRKDLLLGPFMCFLTQLPQIIILFLDICLYDEYHWFAQVTLMCYYLSLMPQLSFFFLYILPSPLYKDILFTNTIIGKQILPMLTRPAQSKPTK